MRPGRGNTPPEQKGDWKNSYYFCAKYLATDLLQPSFTRKIQAFLNISFVALQAHLRP
jgi:hypothetical protein